jgi:hypothetical protein
VNFEKTLEALDKQIKQGEQAKRDLTTLQARVEVAIGICDRVLEAVIAVRGTRALVQEIKDALRGRA